jgi:hypothetical protein
MHAFNLFEGGSPDIGVAHGSTTPLKMRAAYSRSMPRCRITYSRLVSSHSKSKRDHRPVIAAVDVHLSRTFFKVRPALRA